ncbi:hypothetical protein JTB14_016834 [Gonioctena quinquepunctata]|nr:hypothetical protein JTB14_016834 [Gonioctena quinquepunctata]
MIEMDWKFLIILLVCCLDYIHCEASCCSGNNVIYDNETCIDGSAINIADCGMMFLLENVTKSLFFIDDDKNLIDDQGVRMALPHEFCHGRSVSDNGSLIWVCSDEEEVALETTKRSINTAFQLISVFFIILTILVYLTVPQVLDIQGICIIHSIAGLALAYTGMVVINLSGYLSPVPCHLLAYVMYFFFMYSFFWLNVLCFHIWRHVINPQCLQSLKNWNIFYHIYGIGSPLLLLLFVAVAHHADLAFLKGIHPGIGESKCWFKSDRETMIYFYGPISIVLIINMALFIWTAVALWVQSKQCPKTKVLKYRLKMYVKLFFIMGITWIFEVLSAIFLEELKWISYFTDTLNALEGLIIFLILVVFRKKVLRSLANRRFLMFLRLPAKWRELKDSECDELAEEFSLNGNEK